jgi:PAT family beta-lactamase induction signal transducer AmpG
VEERRAPGLGEIFASRKMAAIVLLGFASGLPYYLTNKDLQAWMTLEGVSLETIGYFSLVAWPYTFKFLWAPLVDALPFPFLGRRRGWLLVTQGALLLAIGWMATHDPRTGLQLVAINAIVIAFFSATQDIAFDAYKIDVLREEELGTGAAVGVLGYRVALLVTGGLAFMLADRSGWKATYVVMALLMLVGLAGTLMAPETRVRVKRPNLAEAVGLPFVDFVRRAGAFAVPILAFIVLFKLGDAALNNMATPFLLKAGFTQTEIGGVQGVMGLAATMVGVVVGGAAQARIGLVRCLWIFGILQSAVNLGYWVLSNNPGNHGLMVFVVVLENFFQGTATAALVAYLMSLSTPRFAATQYALLSSFMAFGRDWLTAPAGKLAEVVGWPQFFLLTIAMAIPGILLLPVVAPWNALRVRGAATSATSDDTVGGLGESADIAPEQRI